jgi:eukaryotic-like serine/threonine-protein kinase
MSQPEQSQGTLVGGRYRIIAELGHGGMADVFLARLSGPSGFAKLAVIKRLRDRDQEELTEMRAMFKHEALLAARLNHPGIVQTFEAGEDAHGPFLAMEYLEGQTLSVIAKRGRQGGPALSLACQVLVLCDILSALHYAHELKDYDGEPLKIVHRDVSPQNIFLTYAGTAKLVDFGVAKASTASVETRTGVIKGKIAYMAPEQAQGSDALDQRADVYAVGVLLWESLAGKRFWGKANDFEILTALIRGEAIKLPSAINAAVPPELEAICMKALAHDPDDRFSSALEFQTELERVAKVLSLSATTRDIATFVTDNYKTERALVRDAVQKYAQHELSHSDVIPKLRDDAPLSRQPESYSRSTVENPNQEASELSQSVGRAMKTKRGKMAAVGAAAVLSAALGSAFVFGKSTQAQTPSAPVTATSVAMVEAPAFAFPSAAAPLVAPSDVLLEIAVTPLFAKLYLDDRALGANPFRGRVPTGGAHMLRAEAPGFKTRSIDLTLDKDRSIEFSLIGAGSGYVQAPPVREKATATAPSPKLSESAPASPATAAKKNAFEELTPTVRDNKAKPKLDTDFGK